VAVGQDKGVTKLLPTVNEMEPITKPDIASKMLIEEDCFMCCGSGKTSQWLQSYVAPPDDDDKPCLICFCDSKFGMSTECKHFYCEACIKQYLEAMLNTASFLHIVHSAVLSL